LTVGDEVLVARPGHSHSSPDLAGTILEVAGSKTFPVYRVRWADSGESMTAASAVQPSAARTVTGDTSLTGR
jgi:hypothetical protein